MGCCDICCDEQVEDAIYCCPNKKCTFEICRSCVRDAFTDNSGANYKDCPYCKTPAARAMMEWMCGKGSVRAVEDELRPKVEFEVRKENLNKAERTKAMGEMKERARVLYLDLSELLNMKCPRCSMVFDEYDGCNALICANSSCRAGICAVCLKDCGSDAHSHVRDQHGDYFDKKQFYEAKKTREAKTLADFLETIKDEPFEVKELVRINYEESLPSSCSSTRTRSTASFLATAKKDLELTLRNDRLSVLMDGGETAGLRAGFQLGDISPRSSIPEDYQLVLRSLTPSSSVCHVTLKKFVDGEWRHSDLPNEDKQSGDDVQPTIDALVNIHRTIQCGIIAFKGERQLYQTCRVPHGEERKLSDTEISVSFRPIDRTGKLVGASQKLTEIGCDGQEIVGVNQNKRLVLLEQHLEEQERDGYSKAMFEGLCHYLGVGQPRRLLSSVRVVPQDTFQELNDEQQRVAHPLALKTAVEVAGPPGSGKTKTITELVRSILECTDYEVIVLSERNGAIDAIADKFASDCTERDTKKEVKKVTNIPLWTRVLAFGSAGGIGPSTKLFTQQTKLQTHPELVELRKLAGDRQLDCRKQVQVLLKFISRAINSIEDTFPQGATNVFRRIQLITGGREPGLSRCTEIVTSVTGAKNAIRALVEKGLSGLDEANVKEVVLDHSALLGDLLPIRSIKDEQGERPWKFFKKQIQQVLRQLDDCFSSLLSRPEFSIETAEGLQSAVHKAEETLALAVQRVQIELAQNARVHLCTIGSSHRLPVEGEISADNENVLRAMRRLSVEENTPTKKTIVVFDEAGCIPCYELLGLSRLGRSIEGLVCVGDKHQLAPYSPNMTRGNRNRGRVQQPMAPQPSLSSLLDVSGLSVDDDSKIKLTKQYRVPRDIANLLNVRIYRGDYETAPQCQAPLKGFQFVDVDVDEDRGGQKYVNRHEIARCLELIRQLKREGASNIMVLTPYKKQQRHLEYAAKKNGCYDGIVILTIDQCQGQEADYVILSMVQKPTLFMNKNRLNVALSRVRKKLYFLADKNQLLEASKNSRWESYLIARDLLEFAGDDLDDIEFF